MAGDARLTAPTEAGRCCDCLYRESSWAAAACRSRGRTGLRPSARFLDGLVEQAPVLQYLGCCLQGPYLGEPPLACPGERSLRVA